jgi:hypothetical protein
MRSAQARGFHALHVFRSGRHLRASVTPSSSAAWTVPKLLDLVQGTSYGAAAAKDVRRQVHDGCCACACGPPANAPTNPPAPRDPPSAALRRLLAAVEELRQQPSAALRQVLEAVEELKQQPAAAPPTAPLALAGSWRLLYTTEADVHKIVDGLLLGASVADIRQDINLSWVPSQRRLPRRPAMAAPQPGAGAARLLSRASKPKPSAGRTGWLRPPPHATSRPAADRAGASG